MPINIGYSIVSLDLPMYSVLTFDVTVNDPLLVVEEVQSIKQLTGIVMDVVLRDGATLEQPALQTSCVCGDVCVCVCACACACVI